MQCTVSVRRRFYFRSKWCESATRKCMYGDGALSSGDWVEGGGARNLTLEYCEGPLGRKNHDVVVTPWCNSCEDGVRSGLKLGFFDFTRLFEQLQGRYLSEKRKSIEFSIGTVRKVFLVGAYLRSYRALKLAKSLRRGQSRIVREIRARAST